MLVKTRKKVMVGRGGVALITKRGKEIDEWGEKRCSWKKKREWEIDGEGEEEDIFGGEECSDGLERWRLVKINKIFTLVKHTQTIKG